MPSPSCWPWHIRGFDVIGLTTTAGNVPRSRATRNALALLDHVGRNDIPVYAGAARPIQGKFAYARHVHSPAGLTRRLPNPVTLPSNIGAVRFLAQSLLAEPNDVTVIALGPLTNLARLLKRKQSGLAVGQTHCHHGRRSRLSR